MVCPYCAQLGEVRVLFVDDDQPKLKEEIYILSCLVGHTVEIPRRDYFGKRRKSPWQTALENVRRFLAL